MGYISPSTNASHIVVYRHETEAAPFDSEHASAPALWRYRDFQDGPRGTDVTDQMRKKGGARLRFVFGIDLSDQARQAIRYMITNLLPLTQSLRLTTDNITVQLKERSGYIRLHQNSCGSEIGDCYIPSFTLLLSNSHENAVVRTVSSSTSLSRTIEVHPLPLLLYFLVTTVGRGRWRTYMEGFLGISRV